jgi:hypothetical protein
MGTNGQQEARPRIAPTGPDADQPVTGSLLPHSAEIPNSELKTKLAAGQVVDVRSGSTNPAKNS